MSKIRCFDGMGHYDYFKHCPFCGSVAVDFDHETFRCPDCGAVVTFKLPMREPICDGPADSTEIIERWNRRAGKEITAEDLCVMAQKADMEDRIVYQRHIESQVWEYIVKTATLGKYSCEIPKRYLKDVEKYRKNKFDIEEKGDIYIVSWRKDIKWD